MIVLLEPIITICFVGFGVFGLIVTIDGHCDGDKIKKLRGYLLLLASAVLLSVMIYTSNQFYKASWKREDPYVTHSIMALQDGNEVSGKLRGRRYSMSGYIGEEFMYVYGYKASGGGMKIQKVSANNAVVYFNDDVSPHANWYCETRKFWYILEKRYTCDIFIPTGSLQSEIVLDLK